MSNSGLFSGAGLYNQNNNSGASSLIAGIPVFSSNVFTVPVDGWYTIWAVGAGGSGAIVVHNTTSSYTRVAQGGAGSGFSLVRRKLKKGQRINIVIGAGGAAVVSVAANMATAGNAGGLTSVVCDDFAISITGGAGGQAESVVNTSSYLLSEIAPGHASGGDINYDGGAAGVNTFTGAGSAATGGGSSGNIYGSGKRSGDSNANAYGSSGASVRFASNLAVVGSTVSGAGAGGSNGAPLLFPGLASATNQQAYANDGKLVTFTGSGGISSYNNTLDRCVNPFLHVNDGAAWVSGATAVETWSGNGAGGTGSYLAVSAVGIAGHGGMHGGGGGLNTPLTPAVAASPGTFAGNGGLGAGGGGCSFYSAASGSLKSGAGGNGFVFIEVEIDNAS